MLEHINQTANGSEEIQDINNTDKKPYDGSKQPMVIVPNLKSSVSAIKAQGMVDLRIDWIKSRTAEIKRNWDDPKVPSGEKLTLKSEWERYMEQVPKLLDKREQLQKKLAKIEKDEAKSVSETKLEDISFGD